MIATRDRKTYVARRNVRFRRGRRVCAITTSLACVCCRSAGWATGRVESAIEDLIPGYTALDDCQDQYDTKQDKGRRRLIRARRTAFADQAEDVDGGCIHRSTRRRIAQHVDVIDSFDRTDDRQHAQEKSRR